MRFLIAFMVVFFTCPLVFGSTFEKVDEEISDARKFLNSDSALHREKGENMLAELTGISAKARFFLGLWLIQNPRYNHKKLKMGVSLINSAYCEGFARAGFFMVHVYEGEDEDDIYRMKNYDKAVAILKNILTEKNNYSAANESVLGMLLLKQDAIKNKKEAISWLERSVAQGETISVSLLAPLFTQGEEKDLVKAWFYSDLGGTSMASEKHALEDQMTSEQIEQAQQMSWNWQDAHHIHMPGYRGQASRIHWQVESN